MVATGPTKLAANVPKGHPEVAVLLKQFGEHVDHLLAPQRKLGLVGMRVRHVEHPARLVLGCWNARPRRPCYAVGGTCFGGAQTRDARGLG